MANEQTEENWGRKDGGYFLDVFEVKIMFSLIYKVYMFRQLFTEVSKIVLYNKAKLVTSHLS